MQLWHSGGGAHPREPVLRLVLLGRYQGVIDHAEARAATTAEGHLESVQQDAAGVRDLHSERSAEASEKRQSARRRRSDGRTLYIAASFSFRVAFETPARPGWTTSTSCAGQTKAQADERSASLKSHRSRSRGQAGSVRIAAAATGGW